MGDSEGNADHDHCEVCGCSKEQYHMLRQRVEESKQRITLMESEFLQSTLYTENELDESREELRLSQQRYNALEKSHQELHEINSDLEERILDIAAAYEKEKQALNREVLTLSQRLLDTKFEINKQEERNARYKKDCQLAVELLQCTPSGAYMQHKVSQLPHDLQYYVHQLMGEMNAGGQPPNIPQSQKGTDNNQPLLGSKTARNGYLAGRIYDSVPANIIARAMQLRDEEDRKEVEKLVPTLRSSRSKQEVAVVLHDKGTQTTAAAPSPEDPRDSLCAKCGGELTLIAIEKDFPIPDEPDSEPSVLNLLDLSEPAPAKPQPKKINENLLLDLLDTSTSSETPADLNLKHSLENLSFADLLLDIPNTEPTITPVGATPIEREESSATADILSLISPLDSGSPMQDDMSDTSSASKESNTGTPSSVGSSLTEADAALATPKPSGPKPTGPARRVQSGPTHPPGQQNQKSNGLGPLIESSQQGSLGAENEFKKVGKAAVIKSQQRTQRSPVVTSTSCTSNEDTKTIPSLSKDLTNTNQKGSTIYSDNPLVLPENPTMEEKTDRVSMYINETNAENLKKKMQPKQRHIGSASKPTGQVIGSQHNRPPNPRTNPNSTLDINSHSNPDKNANPNATPNPNPTPKPNPTKAPQFLQTSV